MKFPQDFCWGVATASYQIEGAVAEDGRGPSIWDTFSHTPGKIIDGSTGDIADDHYHRYREDVELLASLGVTHYRFSIAWPRIQPDGRDAINSAGVDFYARLVDALLEHDIQPWVTLYHWDLPQALQDAGGWPVRDTARRFADYAGAIYERLGDRIGYWTTLNEPWCSGFLGYGVGYHAPGIRDRAEALRAAHHLLLGHGLAVQRMRGTGSGPSSQFGLTLNLFPTTPDSDRPEDIEAARRIDGIGNRFFLDPVLSGHYPADVLDDTSHIGDTSHIRDGDEDVIAIPLDFLGVNYYTPMKVRAGITPAGSITPFIGCGDVEFVDQGLPRSDMGWEIEPDGLRRLLARLRDDYRQIPLYVTENGVALRDEIGSDGRVDDPDRIVFIDGHLRAVHQAIDERVDVRGYFVWTFTDNFEWAFGYTKRFGLVYVDYPTGRRIPKTSAEWYARVTRAGELPAPPR